MNELSDNSDLVFKVVMVYFTFFVVKKGLIYYLTNSSSHNKVENVSLIFFI